MINNQQTLNLSPHMNLYDILIPQDHPLRKINDLVDFSFVYDELKDKYCETNGRNAVHPIVMFKYLLLKFIYNLSDHGLVERSRYDMSFKYFLGLQPEDPVIHASSLTKFRKQRLKDKNLLDILIQKSVEVAIQQGVMIHSHSIIIDATHTLSRYHQCKKAEMFALQIEKLENTIKNAAVSYKLPEKGKGFSYKTEETRAYCREVVESIKSSKLAEYPAIREDTELLQEMIEDLANTYHYSIDKDARIGHKTRTRSFYGYKTHLAMTEDRIITAATVTSGEKGDEKELEELIEKTEKNGLEIREVLADKAYSSVDNIEYTQSKNIQLIAKLHPRMKTGKYRKVDGFIFNKDAKLMQCPQGHLALRSSYQKRATSHKNNVIRYFFDIEKCKECPRRKGCYKEGQKNKSYNITIKKEFYKKLEAFEKSPYFKERNRNRYMIEAKNGEIKNQHGYARCQMIGLDGLELQGAMTIFAVNLKRIIKLQGGSLPIREE